MLSLPASAQFSLGVRKDPLGMAKLSFTLAPGYYYSLESSSEVAADFAQASGWMLGNGTVATWTVHYPTSPTASGGAPASSIDIFSLYPFTADKTLVSWRDLAEVRYNAIVAQDYRELPPTVTVPESETTPGVILLVGRIMWNSAYDAFSPSLLPADQQTVLARLPTPAAALAAATPGGTSAPGVIIDDEKRFFRIRRMALDADGDGLDWAQETFLLNTNPDAANTPANLTATADADGIHLAWQGSTPSGGGTIIERRESMDTDGPFTIWHELHRVTSPQTTWLDTRLAPGEYVIYRVRFYYPFNGTEYHTAASNLKRAVMRIDTDSDGTPDGPPPDGDDGTGGGPITDPPPPPDGGDDPVIPGDGDGDGDPDNDKDGVVDTGDYYPDDDKRSQDIPVKVYGVIDLSSNLTSPLDIRPNAQGRPLITINDDNKVAFFGEVQGAPGQLRTVVWNDGTTTEFPTDLEPWTSGGYDYTLGVSPAGIAADGALAGHFGLHWSDGDGDGMSGTFTMTDGQLTRSPSVTPPPQPSENVYDHIQLFSTEGITFGIDNERVPDPNAFIVKSTPFCGSHRFTEFEYRSDEPPKSCFGQVMSANGHVVWGESWAEPEELNYYLWDPDAEINRPVPNELNRAWCINDQNQVVGYISDSDYPPRPSSDERGDLGFLWSPTDGMKTFHDLLPEKFKKQMRNAVPFLITNQDAAGAYQITFTAQSWERVGSTVDWVWEAFVFTKTGTEEPTIHEMLFPRIYDSDLGKYRSISFTSAAVNADGVYVGVLERPAPASTPAQNNAAAAAAPTIVAAAGSKIEFMPVDILRGFDPPMAGDTNDDGKADNDKDDPDRWVWWTSVARVPTGGADDLNQQRLKVVFKSDELAKTHELRILPGSEDLIDLLPSTGTGAIVPADSAKLSITAKDAEFIIKGEDPAGKTGRQEAIVGVFQKDSGEVMARLKVRVMPPITLELAVWTMDGGTPATTVVAKPNINVSAIHSRINKAFRQACVLLHLEGVHEIQTPYDSNGDGKYSVTELGGISGAIDHNKAQINLVFVRNGQLFANTAPNEQYVSVIRTVAIEGNPTADGLAEFELACAHEVGHQLGLATRNSTKEIATSPKFEIRQNANHDTGRFPNKDNGFKLADATKEVRKGLMASAGFQPAGGLLFGDWKEWLRNEDWLKANEIAKTKKEEPLPWALKPITIP